MKAEQLRQMMGRYAESQGFELNPDEEVVSLIIKGLLENEARYGYRYCPCRVLTGDRAKDAKLICPCPYHRGEIESMGHCHCGLFVARNFKPPADLFEDDQL